MRQNITFSVYEWQLIAVGFSECLLKRLTLKLRCFTLCVCFFFARQNSICKIITNKLAFRSSDQPKTNHNRTICEVFLRFFPQIQLNQIQVYNLAL